MARGTGRLALIAIVLLLNSIAAYAQYDSLYVDNRWRTFLVHLPPAYQTQPDTLFPLLLAMHGGFGSAYNLQDQSALSEKADTTVTPFVVVYPEGVRSLIGIRSWNAGSCCGYARDNDINDVGFISTLIDTLLSRYRIDQREVYATGISNGGMLSFRLAVELAGKIAAIAPVAGALVVDGPWSPERPVPVIQFHSYLDENVPFYGGEGGGFSNEPYPPADSVLNVWSGLSGCGVENDTLFHEVGEYLFKTWTQCNDNADIQLYVTYDGGHSWPGGREGFPGADPPSEKINADNLMLPFFLDHPLGGSLSTGHNKVRPQRSFEIYQNYPNPFNPRTLIRFDLARAGAIELSIFNARGRRVRALVSGVMGPGHYEAVWDGRDDEGADLSSGVYLYRLRTGSDLELRKMLLTR